MGPGDIVPVRRTSITLVPPGQDDEDRIEDPTKTEQQYYGDPNTSSAPRRHTNSFHFDFASSPALGESALSPPQPARSQFERQPHARSSSCAVPWLDPTQLYAPDPEAELTPRQVSQSRFSPYTSSLSNTSAALPSPTVHQSNFSPTNIVYDGTEDRSAPDTPPATSHSTSNLDSSPPPPSLRGDLPLSSPRSPSDPSAWRSFFARPLPPATSRFSASTTSAAMGPDYLLASPSPPRSSSSSSGSFDGTSSPPLMALPELATEGSQRRVQPLSLQRYSRPFPTTYLEAIEEDEVYPTSPQTAPPIPRRSSDRPRRRFSETEMSDSSSGSAEFTKTPAGALAALSAAAGGLNGTSRNNMHLHLPPPAVLPQGRQRWSNPPQIPPLPRFDHNTSSLQRLFSYYPSPRLASETPHLAQEPFPTAARPWSPVSSLLSFGSVVGPQGERLASLREKRKTRGVYWADGEPKKTHRRCGIRGMSWKLWAVVLLLLVLVFGVIAVGVGVGLGQGNGNDGNATLQNNNGAGNATDGQQPNQNGTDRPVFPAGTYRILTTLRNVTTSCSNISATWNCAPGAAQTYWEASANLSAVTVVWKVDQNNLTEGLEGNGFAVSSAGDPFALQFLNAPLTLREQGGENEHWGFETGVRKRVRPSVDVSGRNVAVECEYVNVQLSARLFTLRQPQDGFAGGADAWPGAVEVEERSEAEGSCAEVRNGVFGQTIAVGAGPADCSCGYSNYDPGDV